jgi:hypothetical protein
MNNTKLFLLLCALLAVDPGESFYLRCGTSSTIIEDVKVTNNSTEEAIPVYITDEEVNVRVANEGSAEAIPVTITDASLLVQGDVSVSATSPLPIEQRVPLAVSGEWTSAGMTISPSTLIVHDIFFYVASDTSPPCNFAMNYVIDQVGTQKPAPSDTLELFRFEYENENSCLTL